MEAKTSKSAKAVKETATVTTPTTGVKAKLAAAKEKKALKVNKADKAVIDSKTLKDTVKQTVESSREMKYRYPAEVTGQVERKQFRVKLRNKDKSFLKEIDDFKKAKDDKGLAKANKAYAAFRKENYLVP